MERLGQHPHPRHRVIHLSDTHFLADEHRLFGSVDTDLGLTAAVNRLASMDMAIEAIVITGDLADRGEPDAYRRLKSIIEPAAHTLSIPIVWVMGNHDKRAPFAAELFGEEATDAPQDRTWDIGGLRVIALDTSVPGYHHGEITDEQLDWLAQELRTPAVDGTILALHHPPVPCPVEIMGVIELKDQARLAGVIAGTDVRSILAGHLHYSTYGTFAGVPVAVAAATCYTIDVQAAPRGLSGVNGSQSFNLVEVFDDHIVHSIIPAFEQPAATEYSSAFYEELLRMTPAERIEAFSKQR